MNPTQNCEGFGDQPAHELEASEANFAKWALSPSQKHPRCRNCDRAFNADRRARKAGEQVARFDSPAVDGERISAAEASRSHEYIADKDLLALWDSVTAGTLKHGDPPANIVFFGPKGSGKTDGAAYLAARVGLPFTKVDAASMTDPEAWFGTREVVVEQGVSVTRYEPSAFVTAVQQPGVIFIDEMNRVDDEHRNVLLPLTDGTGRVTNPLTGQVVARHPHAFIIMAGNRGLQYTGTNAVDPAFTSRALTVEFDYLTERDEQKVLMDATGCDADTAAVFARFAQETRAKAKADPDFDPIGTREAIMAARRVARGLNRDLAARYAIINAASDEGGSASIRSELEAIWAGVRLTRAEADAPTGPDPVSDPNGWVCPVHGQAKTVPAGISKAGKPFNAFRACPVFGCEHTEDKDRRAAAAPKGAGAQKTCGDCGTVNPPGRTTLCVSCGAAL